MQQLHTVNDMSDCNIVVGAKKEGKLVLITIINLMIELSF